MRQKHRQEKWNAERLIVPAKFLWALRSGCRCGLSGRRPVSRRLHRRGVHGPVSGAKGLIALALLLANQWAAAQENTGGASDAQGQSPAPRAEERAPFNILRQEEDWRFLRAPAKRMGWWDRAKYVPLGKKGWLTTGGQTREFFEYIGAENWGGSPAKDNNYLLQRYMLHADFHFNDTTRLFAELKSGLEIGRTGGPRPSVDQDDLDTNQLFFEVSSRPPSDKAPPLLALRAGRQELNFGAGRLVSVREGPNVRVGFDGLFGIARFDGWRVDAFTSRPVQIQPRTFDDGTDYSQMLWGVYATGLFSAKRPKAANLDLYYLGQERRGAVYDQGAANERRHTLGFRVWSAGAPFDYDFEPNYQVGTFGGGDIAAWGVSANVGYTFPRTPQNVRLGLAFGINSGDRDPNNRDLNTYSPPAPSGRYFGQIPSLGPQNVQGFSPSLSLQPVPKLTLTASDYFFWRQSLSDGVYGLNGFPLQTGQKSRAAYIGSQPEINLLWQIDRHATLTLDYAIFFAGDFLRETPPGQDIHYFGGWFTYLF